MPTTWPPSTRSKLRELIDLWWAEAGPARRAAARRPDGRAVRRRAPARHRARWRTWPAGDYVYYPPVTHIPADACPPLSGRPWLITAEIEVGGPAQGVLYARGSHNVGHSFFLHDGQLHFDYNALGTHYRASAPLDLDPGRHVLTARFERDRAGGQLTIGADGRDLDTVAIPSIIRMLGSTGLDIGRDSLSPVVSDYAPPFPFEGRIERITFSVRPAGGCRGRGGHGAGRDVQGVAGITRPEGFRSGADGY